MKLELVSIEYKTEYDEYSQPSDYMSPDNYAGLPQDEIDKYIAQDNERIEAFNRDEWHYVMVYAEATLRFRTDHGGGWQSPFTVASPGVCGIESDYLDPSFKSEQLDELEAQLAALGYEMTQSDFDNVIDYYLYATEYNQQSTTKDAN